MKAGACIAGSLAGNSTLACDPSATIMSVGAKTKYQQAQALVDRKPVRDGFVLSTVARSSATSTICHSRHANSRGPCSGIDAAPFEAIDTRPNAPHQRCRCAESP